MASKLSHSTSKRSFIILVVILLSALVWSSASAVPATHYVAPGGTCGGAAPCYATIQAAVDAAAAGDEIKIATGTYTGINNLGGLAQVIYINKAITLRGGYSILNWTTADPLANPTTVNAQGLGRVIAVIGPAEVTIVGLRLTGGNAYGLRGYPDNTVVNAGGGVYAQNTTLTIESCTIFSNTASTEASKSGYGGGIFVYGGRLAVRSSTIESNLGSPIYYGVGGGLYITTSTAVELTGNLIQNNTGSTNQLNAGGGNGGGIHIDDSSAVLTENMITGNTGSTGPGGLASASGGGVYVSGGSLQMSENTLSGNIAALNNYGWGGALYLSECDATLADNTFDGNKASTSLISYGLGGGIYAHFGNVISLTDNQILNNIAASGGTGWGGGIYIDESNATLTGNNVSGNTSSTGSTGYGGGIFLAGSTGDPGVFVLQSNAITGNQASSAAAGYGGGVEAGYDSYNTDLTMNGNLLRTNTAGASTEGVGGGMRITDSQADLSGNIILENQALASSTGTGNGGGMYATGSDLTMINNVVAGNHANTHGAGIYFTSPDQYIYKIGQLVHNTIADNNGCGEGIYGYTWIELNLTNTIVSGHSSYGVVAATASYTSIDLDSTLWYENGTDSGGSGAITRLNDYSGNPTYTAPLTGNYHLGSSSAAIDKGVNALVGDDMDGQLRPNGAASDLGADEYYASGGPAEAEMQAFAPQWFLLADPGTGEVHTTLHQRYLLQFVHHDTPGYITSFTDLLPGDFSFQSELHAPTMTFSQQDGTLNWQTDQLLPADQAAQILLTAISDQIAPLSAIINQAEVSAGLWNFDLEATSQAPLFPPLISSPGNGEICRGNLEVSGVAFPNTIVRIYENSVEKAITTADASGAFTVTYPTAAGVNTDIYLNAASCLQSAPDQCSAPSAQITLKPPLSFICPQPSTMVNTPVSGPLAGQTLVYRFMNDSGWFVGDGGVFHLVPPHVNSDIHLYRRSCAEMGAPANSVESVWLEIVQDDVIIATYHPSTVDLPWYHFLIDMELADESRYIEFFLACEWESLVNSGEVSELVFSSGMMVETSLLGTVFDVTKGFDPEDPGAAGVDGISVTAMVYAEDWGGWVPWPAHLYNDQINPQITGEDGQFIFFVPSDSYYLEVDGGTNYQSWRSSVMAIGAEPLQINVPLTPRSQGVDYNVSLGSFGPYPAILNVGVGDVVQWSVDVNPELALEEQMDLINNPLLRPLSTGAFDPLLSRLGFDGGMMIPGNIYHRQFDQVGTYVYSDGAGHTGSVNVCQRIMLPIILR
jgi:hypothetical protein